jgi:CRP-like cAMP-binding protein
LATLGRSTVLGEYGMFTGERRNATVTAKGPVAVLTLDYERFRRFMIAFPEGTIALLKSAVLRQMKMREDI